MAGSPEYISLLHHVQTMNPPTNKTMESMQEAWDWFEQAQNAITLRRVARNAFHFVATCEKKSINEVIQEAEDLHLRKNAGYAGHSKDAWSNFRLATKFGVTPVQGVFVRMSDKWSRILSLTQNPDNDQVGESLIDTARDLAAYALIADCLITENNNG